MPFRSHFDKTKENHKKPSSSSSKPNMSFHLNRPSAVPSSKSPSSSMQEQIKNAPNEKKRKRGGRPKGRKTTSHSHLIRPKRPRSAYNFFVKYERNKIVHDATTASAAELKNKEESLLPSLKTPSTNKLLSTIATPQEDDSQVEIVTIEKTNISSFSNNNNTSSSSSSSSSSDDYFRILLTDRNQEHSDGGKKKRGRPRGSHYRPRKKTQPHGLVDFHNLTKATAAKWKSLSPEAKKPFEEFAKRDLQHYHVAMKQYNRQVELFNLSEEKKKKQEHDYDSTASNNSDASSVSSSIVKDHQDDKKENKVHHHHQDKRQKKPTATRSSGKEDKTFYSSASNGTATIINSLFLNIAESRRKFEATHPQQNVDNTSRDHQYHHPQPQQHQNEEVLNKDSTSPLLSGFGNVTSSPISVEVPRKLQEFFDMNWDVPHARTLEKDHVMECKDSHSTPLISTSMSVPVVPDRRYWDSEDSSKPKRSSFAVQGEIVDEEDDSNDLTNLPDAMSLVEFAENAFFGGRAQPSSH